MFRDSHLATAINTGIRGVENYGQQLEYLFGDGEVGIESEVAAYVISSENLNFGVAAEDKKSYHQSFKIDILEVNNTDQLINKRESKRTRKSGELTFKNNSSLVSNSLCQPIHVYKNVQAVADSKIRQEQSHLKQRGQKDLYYQRDHS